MVTKPVANPGEVGYAPGGPDADVVRLLRVFGRRALFLAALALLAGQQLLALLLLLAGLALLVVPGSGWSDGESPDQ
ncbi:hypothetical protein FG87_38895 [Nocardia vulneris]|uniref:Uncharacterized protein n=1 Tax=Nocardia vulneris TaxID=1141657 RepID=A0ABR4Z4D4_9NOCA|nr:hypothetical protein FG87_38895 [Nocardia vulneris]